MYEMILPFVMFEILEPENSSRLILDFDDDNNKQEMFDQMRDLGYETHNSIQNLGSLSIFQLIYTCRLFYLIILKIVNRNCQ